MSRFQRTACWLAAVLMTGATGGLVASIAPPRLRLLGLFAITLGAALGWLAGRLAISLRMPLRRVAVAGGLLTGVVGCVVVAMLNWQTYSRELKAAEKPNAGQAFMANMLKAAEDAGASSPESEAALAEFRDSATRALAESRQRRSFRGYLTHRAAGLGLAGFAAAALWSVEVLLAGAAGAIVARRYVTQPFCDICDEYLKVSRRHRFVFPQTSRLVNLVPEIGDPADAAVTVQLLSCGCQEELPRMSFEVVNGAVAGMTAGTREVTREELTALSRLMDQADGIGVES